MFEKVEAYHRPATLREALRLLESGKGRARIVAGGTDLVVEGDATARILVDITRAGLSYVKKGASGWAIGATTTMAEMEESAPLADLAGGLLISAARWCGSPLIRNRATIGGNIAHASPAADLASPLLVLDASVVLADSKGRRKVPLSDYLIHARSSRYSRALLVEIAIPKPPSGRACRWAFQKFGRTAVDISIVNVAAGLELDGRGKVKWARIALGSVSPAPMRASGAEKQMAGQELDGALLREIAAEVAREVSPISDARASADYRRELCGVLTRRALEECAAKAGVTL